MALSAEALDRDVACARLRRIEELVHALEARLPAVERSLPDTDAWLAAERLLDQAVRTASRLAAQLVAAGALGAPESAAGMFERLGESGWLASGDARTLAARADAADAPFEGAPALVDAAASRAEFAETARALRGFLRASARRIGGAPG